MDRQGSERHNGPGRAGRNLPAAIGVGFALGGIAIASLVFNKQVFLVLIVAASAICVWELTTAFRHQQIRIPMVPVVATASMMPLAAYFGGEEPLLAAFTGGGLAVLLWRTWLRPGARAVRDVAAGVFTLAYLALLASFAALMLAEDDGAGRIVVFVLVTISSDIGGYAAGVLWGKHPMAPSVSPKKSWEGLAGSMALSGLVGAVSVVVFLGAAPWVGVVAGASAVVAATTGDLSESLLKRDLGIKDMSNLLPGHGGLMDRLDSLLLTAPVLYLVLKLLVPQV
ncbi:MAG: phosphatidate cytidylyltransferase [Micrococcales bacterium]|nr:MAG: phosphatidate cytidylyltransferase [Micrococcales bacterium]